MYKVILRRVRVTTVVVENQQVLNIMSVCVSNLAPFCVAVFLIYALLILLYFSTSCFKRQGFQEKIIEHKMCVLIASAVFV